jgi:hypothetical protein
VTNPEGPKRWPFTAALVASAAVWCLLVGVVVGASYKLDGRSTAIAISLVPGVALFLYVIWRPSRRNIEILAISALVGVLAAVVNARYMASPSCTGDSLCGINIVNAPGLEIGTFGVLSLTAHFVSSRRGGRSRDDR